MRKAIGIGGVGAMAVVAIMVFAVWPVNAVTYLDANKFDIWAGKNTDVGDVRITHDGVNVYLEVKTTGDWYITEVHIDLGDDLSDIPQKNGNPPPGKFQFGYNYDLSAKVQLKEYTIDVDDTHGWDQVACDPLYVAVHLVVNQVQNGQTVQTQTGWTGDKDFSGKNWAKYFVYECKCPDTPGFKYITGNSVYSSNSDAYWHLNLFDASKTKTGEIHSYCMEQLQYWDGRYITEVSVYSSYSSQATSLYFNGKLIDADHWCMINWVLNNHAGYNNEDVQEAIWELCGSTDASTAGGQELVEDAHTYGVDYHPYHGGWLAFIVRLPNTSAANDDQDMIIIIDP